MTTVYAHLETICVEVGDQLCTGDPLGTEGRSGNVPDGVPDHLHFEVRVGGAHRDPLEFLI